MFVSELHFESLTGRCRVFFVPNLTAEPSRAKLMLEGLIQCHSLSLKATDQVAVFDES